MSALTKAKNLLMLTDPTTLDKAETEATLLFESKYSRYRRLKYMSDTFTSTNMLEKETGYIWVYFSESVIRKMYSFFEISTSDDDYAGDYEVEEIDRTNNRVLVKGYFVDGVTEVEFTNKEKSIYESALAYYICSIGRYTNQSIIAGDGIVNSTQIGQGNITISSPTQFDTFKRNLEMEGDRLLSTKEFSCFL